MDNLFGLFIHWGIYALTEDHEQALARRDLPHAGYEALTARFDPVRYDPNEWVRTARAAGMRYICFTAKHHDGFCMWDTAATDYNIMHTPYGRDVLKMLADACEWGGMKLSIYYSLPDWHEPCAYNPASSHQWKATHPELSDTAAYRAFVRQQIGELLTNYGEIYTLFWDIPPHIADASMNEYVRSLQPGILINDRGYDAGDFSTPERSVPEGGRFTRRTEACQSVGAQSWGYRRDEDYFTPRYLMASIDRVMAKGGSYLLNIGPDAAGELPAQPRAILQRIGEWYNRVRPSLEGTEGNPTDYGVRANPMMRGDGCIAVRAGARTYLHFPEGLTSSAVYLHRYPCVPRRAVLLNTGMPLCAAEAYPPSEIDECGRARGPVLRLSGIPADREPLLTEPAVIELAW